MKIETLAKSQSIDNHFPCGQCGAMLKYKPGTQHQVCEYCNHQNEISANYKAIEEYDLHRALNELANAKPSKTIEQAHCNACGANFKFAASVHAGECPFCGTDIVTSPQKC